MSIKNILSLILISIFIISCGDKKGNNTTSTSSFNSPESGQLVNSGDLVNIDLTYSDGLIDSIQYLVDATKIETKTDTSVYQLKTTDLPLGSRLITAKIFRKGVVEEVTSNIVLVSSKTPERYGYKIINTYNHSKNSYTQGLEFHDGAFYEGTGTNGNSKLMKVTVDGKVLQQTDVANNSFGEGITVVGDKIIQLTYTEKVVFEYDKQTLKLLKTYPYNHAAEGWGLTFDGEIIYNTDGSNRIYLLSKNTYQPKGYLEVYDNVGPVDSLNELEWIDGKIYANIYTSELVAIINPKTGEVEAYINLMGLPHGTLADPDQEVLNGIAYDKKGKRLFVTGKNWDKLFQIQIVKQ